MGVGRRRKIKIRSLVVGRRRANLLRLSRRAVVPRCARNGISVDHNWQVGGAQKRTCKVRRLPRRLANINSQGLAFFTALGNIRSAKPTPPICLRLGVSCRYKRNVRRCCSRHYFAQIANEYKSLDMRQRRCGRRKGETS